MLKPGGLVCQVKNGRLSYADFGRQAAFTLGSDLRASYLGYATKLDQLSAGI